MSVIYLLPVNKGEVMVTQHDSGSNRIQISKGRKTYWDLNVAIAILNICIHFSPGVPSGGAPWICLCLSFWYIIIVTVTVFVIMTKFCPNLTQGTPWAFYQIFWNFYEIKLFQDKQTFFSPFKAFTFNENEGKKILLAGRDSVLSIFHRKYNKICFKKVSNFINVESRSGQGNNIFLHLNILYLILHTCPYPCYTVTECNAILGSISLDYIWNVDKWSYLSNLVIDTSNISLKNVMLKWQTSETKVNLFIRFDFKKWKFFIPVFGTFPALIMKRQDSNNFYQIRWTLCIT